MNLLAKEISRKINFGEGPAVLPDSVLAQIKETIPLMKQFEQNHG